MRGAREVPTKPAQKKNPSMSYVQATEKQSRKRVRERRRQPRRGKNVRPGSGEGSAASGRVLTSSEPLGTLGMEQYFMVSLTKNCC